MSHPDKPYRSEEISPGGDVPSGLNGGKAQASTNNRSCCEFARLHCSLFQVLGCQADREVG